MYGTVVGGMLLCFLSGAVFSLPYFFESCFPFTYVGLFCLFLLLGKDPMKSKNFWGMFCFVLGFALPLCSWFWEMYPLSFMGISQGVALLAVLFCCVVVPAKIALQYAAILWVGKFLPQHPLLKALGYGALWALAEWTLQFGVLAFPWGTVAMAQTGCLPVLQTVSLLGTEWVSFAAVAVCALSAQAFLHRKRYLLVTGTSLLAGVFATGIVVLLFGNAKVKEIPVAVLQGNISTEEKWDDEATTEIYETYLAMATEAAESGAKIIVLPETAIPVEFEDGGILHGAFGELASTYDCTVVLGVFRSTEGNQHNSVVAISPDETLSSYYDKQNPIPFGEYMPYGDFLGSIIPSLSDLNPEGALTVEDTLSVIESKNYRIGCFVCFDSAFDGYEQASGDSDFLTVVTNDAWFGTGVGPAQHLRQAKLRAVESGKALVRAGNTGITAILDRDGQLLSRVDMERESILCGKVPIYNGKTMFGRIGDAFLLLCAGYLLSAAGYQIYRKKKER
jgi:apolipoprotein N-acyltransferase